jgi:hypothetical protein
VKVKENEKQTARKTASASTTSPSKAGALEKLKALAKGRREVEVVLPGKKGVKIKDDEEAEKGEEEEEEEEEVSLPPWDVV